MTEERKITETDFNKQVLQLIDGAIESLHLDKSVFLLDAVSDETKNFYSNFMPGNENKLLQSLRVGSSGYFIQLGIKEYLKQVKSRKAHPTKIAFSAGDAKILVWAEIKDDDSDTEDALIMSEAATNSELQQYGFSICSTIIEESDNLQVPPHYREVKNAQKI